MRLRYLVVGREIQNRERLATGVPARAARMGWWMRPGLRSLDPLRFVDDKEPAIDSFSLRPHHIILKYIFPWHDEGHEGGANEYVGHLVGG